MTPAQERMLAQIAVGDLPIDDPRVAEALADPAFRTALAQLQELQAHLDAEGREQAAAMAGADRLAEPGDAELVAAALARLRTSGAPVGHDSTGTSRSPGVREPDGIADPTTVRPWRRHWFVAAAALLAALCTFCMFQGDELPRGSAPADVPVLGGGPVRIKTIDWVDAGLQVTWSSELPSARFTVEIVDPARGVPIARKDSPGATTWTFAVTRGELPAGSIVRVHARSRGQVQSDEDLVPR